MTRVVCLLFAGLVVFRFTDLYNTQAAGISICALETVALGLHLRVAFSRRLSAAAKRPYRFTSPALALLIIAGVGFSVAFNTHDRSWGVATVAAVALRTLAVPVLLLGLLSFAAEPMDRRARWKLGMDVATVLGAGAMLMWYLVLGPVLQAGGLLDPLRLGAVLFAVGDVVLLVGVGTVLLRGSAVPSRGPLVLMLAGTAGYLVVDTVFLYTMVHDGALHDAVVPTALHLPMFLILLASTVRQETAGGAAAGRRLRRNAWLPYAALAGGFALLVVAAAKAGLFPWLGLVLGALVMTVGVAARQVLASRENYTLVVTDSLTGLANRIQLRGALTAAVDRHRRTGAPVAVLLIDLNGFKQVNDGYGHEVGDQMLVAFADVLRRTVRDADVPARLGGDEFAVVLPGCAEEATQVAERILAACQAPVNLSGHRLELRASIGVAVAQRGGPDAGSVDPNELLHRADLAMYAAKRRGTPSWAEYTADAMDAEQAVPALADDLARAADAGQLRLLYQPIVALESGDLVAVEALVRWQHPTRGLLGPDTFIPLAEQTGLIHGIGGWVLREACRQVGAWQAELPPGRSLHLSVNLSPIQLERPALADEILEVLEREGFDPRALVVEMTESALVDDRSAVPQLERLRARGVRVALDDFGTGYSSLRYLTRLPVDILKLDRCFVADLSGDPERAAVAEAVIRLSQILHMDTVAEGIEDPAQATELTLLGYRTAQGFHFARPLPAGDVEALLHRSAAEWPSLPTALDPAAPRPVAVHG
ncbi:bifunctional diguanylate cyclase/phosphodiesterase [Dactylosporangium sp. NPDC006015]|uniref:putative bifunctional diguanylate cyclase/phosphodiesterase n=1 Tax=Dactylosporangium sp. NPDC006015 TaxID=3154576 RepID=UPI0033BB73FD